MRKIKYTLLIAVLIPAFCFAQQKDEAKNYYVSSVSTAIFDTTSLQSNILITLGQHKNVKVLPTKKEGWIKVMYLGKVGYSINNDYKPGTVKINTYRYRTGAVCKDGSRSSATGKGACSHHRGVSRWTYGSRETVRIID